MTVVKTGHKSTKCAILILIFTGLMTFNNCENKDTATGSDDDDIESLEVVIEPQEVTFEVGEQQEFSAFLISATGDTVNDEFEVDWNWYSSDPNVFTVEDGGTAYGENPGEAFCIVEAEIVSEKMKTAMKFVPIGRDSAFVTLLN